MDSKQKYDWSGEWTIYAIYDGVYLSLENFKVVYEMNIQQQDKKIWAKDGIFQKQGFYHQNYPFQMDGQLQDDGDTADIVINWLNGGTSKIHVKIDEASTEFEGTFFTSEDIKGSYFGLKNIYQEPTNWSGEWQMKMISSEGIEIYNYVLEIFHDFNQNIFEINLNGTLYARGKFALLHLNDDKMIYKIILTLEDSKHKFDGHYHCGEKFGSIQGEKIEED